MPCWTVTETKVALDAKGLDHDRLIEAANEVGVRITFRGSTAIFTDRRGRMSEETMTRRVKQAYSRLTVATGLKKFGFKVQGQTEQNGVLKLTLGR